MATGIAPGLVAIAPLALRGKLLLPILTLATCDLERGNDSITGLEVTDVWAHGIHFPAGFVSENVVLAHPEDCAVIQMKIATTDTESRDLDNDIVVTIIMGLGDLTKFVVSLERTLPMLLTHPFAHR
jgi:hypothetical protein